MELDAIVIPETVRIPEIGRKIIQYAVHYCDNIIKDTSQETAEKISSLIIQKRNCIANISLVNKEFYEYVHYPTLPVQIVLNHCAQICHTVQETTRFITSISCVNRKLHNYINDPFVIKDIIRAISAKLAYSEEYIAKSLKMIPSAVQYLKLSTQLVQIYVTTENIQKLVAAGADINFRSSSFGTTPLLAAARENKLDNVKTLLSLGADVNQWSCLHGGTALLYAIYNGNIAIIKEILAYKPDYLHLADAIRINNEEIVRLICDVRTDAVNQRPRGNTMHLFCCNNDMNPSIVRYLLDKGLNPDKYIVHSIKKVFEDIISFQNPDNNMETVKLFHAYNAHNPKALLLARAMQQKATEIINILEKSRNHTV